MYTSYKLKINYYKKIVYILEKPRYNINFLMYIVYLKYTKKLKGIFSL